MTSGQSNPKKSIVWWQLIVMLPCRWQLVVKNPTVLNHFCIHLLCLAPLASTYSCLWLLSVLIILFPRGLHKTRMEIDLLQAILCVDYVRCYSHGKVICLETSCWKEKWRSEIQYSVFVVTMRSNTAAVESKASEEPWKGGKELVHIKKDQTNKYIYIYRWLLYVYSHLWSIHHTIVCCLTHTTPYPLQMKFGELIFRWWN